MSIGWTRALVWCVIAAVLAPVEARAEVRLHGLFTDGAVLQRGIRVRVWGYGRDGERVTVTIAGQSARTVARSGRWMVRLQPMPAGGPHTLSVSGDNRLVVRDVLIGDVWVCSGQSNMEFPLRRADGGAEAIARSNDPMLRLCTIPRVTADEPLHDVEAPWQPCGPETVPAFSAVAYYFGRDLRRALGVPIGLINANRGATPAEAWTSRGALAADPVLRGYLAGHARAIDSYPAALSRYTVTLHSYHEAAAIAARDGAPAPAKPRAPVDPRRDQHRPTCQYNAIIAPLQPYAIRGVIWYQGEGNVGQARLYRRVFGAMIRDWHRGWGQGDFPFLFVQLAPHMKIVSKPAESAWAELRESQELTCRDVPRTGMAVITDFGDEADIHPRWKEPVGARLALLARRIAYGERVQASGPVLASCRFARGAAVLQFRETAGGLIAKGGPQKGFALAGPDRRFHWAEATCSGDTVTVISPSVPRPVAVRYGWADCPVVNLFNGAGLPASPFRTDHWPMTSDPKPAPAR